MRKPKQVVEPSKDQDHLEAYPEKKQVSAFPERRFIKMNRMLVIVALINLACILAGASLFIYTAKHVDIRVQNKNGLLIYQLDREAKRLKQAEYHERKISARMFIMENFLRQYITKYHSFNGTRQDENNLLSEKGLTLRAAPKIKDAVRKEMEKLQSETYRRGIVRDVHIYNLHLEHGLWTAVIETFDFPRPDGPPACDCMDNSKECLKCKYEKTILRQRKRIWIRASFMGSKYGYLDTENNSKNPNPFGIQIDGYYVGYMPKDAVTTLWDLPPELR